MKCSKCRRRAIIFQRYSGLHLCKHHFTLDVERKAKRAIRSHSWIRPGDRIGVALSGGKDSAALLYFLSTILRDRRDVDLCAITIDEGIAGYRDPAVPARIAAALGVEWTCRSFSEAYGTTIDAIVAPRGDELSCSYCGVLRRALLNATARQIGTTRLALGLNLDDEAQSVLMNVLRGDPHRLLRTRHPAEGMVPRIKPFLTVPEREVALYAHLHVEGFDTAGCPYAHNALRADVRSMLNDYAYQHPATKNALVNLGEYLAGIGDPAGPDLVRCERCGEPCGASCRCCQIIDEVCGHE